MAEVISRRVFDMRALVGAVAVFLLLPLTSTGTGNAQTKPPRTPAIAECPTEDEIKDIIRNWRIESNRTALFPATAVDRFEFGPIRIGRPAKTKTAMGDLVDACPTRFTYSFVTTMSTGQEMKTTDGASSTFSFYRDSFDEWTFVIDAR